MKAAVTTLLGAEPNGSDSLDDEGHREMLEVINAEIDRLNRLLEGLIDIAKIEAGAMEPRRAWSNLDEVISIALTRASHLTSHYRVRLELEKNLPLIRIDEKAMAEVLYILVENATKYSPVSTDILITATKREDDIKVSVEDHGVGIPPELRERVFDKFFRFTMPDSVNRNRGAGLGMGLAIARGIVEAHKGRIWIEDSSGAKGTRVSFTIPFKQEEMPVA
jgi:two-component system sensor histidine kinase KdpD